MEHLPIIGITMGDPAGIGPEIAVKAMSDQGIRELCRALVIGGARFVEQAVDVVGGGVEIHGISDPGEARFEPGVIDVIGTSDASANPSDIEHGVVSAAAGRAAFQAIEKAIQLALGNRIQATVTCPINKEALHLAGCPYAGHTEIFAALSSARSYAMMLIVEGLRVAHVSTHRSLREACDLVTRDRVREVIRLAHDACRDLGIERPRIGVAGLNPHAGEGGLFGAEERERILPAIADARSMGIRTDGPLPPDTAFVHALGGRYDAIIAMYHDQGHIPIKLIGFTRGGEGGFQSVSGVNVTLGLPIVRTSVDHGTAFDIAGTGRASPRSLIEAIEVASLLARLKMG